MSLLEEIVEIKNYGVFSKYKPQAAALSFLKFNLFYGWNGSGKTTLSRMLDSLSGQVIPTFPEGDFEIKVDGNKYSKATIGASNLRIAVFNQDFVRKNLDFEAHKAKSILYISEEKIEEKKKLDQKHEELKNLLKEKNQKHQAVADLEHKISSELTKLAKNIKSSFGLIKATNSKFLNYNKAKLSSFIDENRDKIIKENILSAEALEKNQLSSQSTQKPNVTQIEATLDISEIELHLKNIQKNVASSIATAQIKDLIANEVLNKWVEEGLSIHKGRAGQNCEFCKNTISEDRMKELEAHFSNEYKNLIDNLGSDLAWIEEIESSLTIDLVDSGEFYTEFQETVKKQKSEIELTQKSITSILTEIKNAIVLKKDNPFKIVQCPDVGLIKDKYKSLLDMVTKYNEIAESHNSKNSDFTKSISKSEDLLELHFVCEQTLNSSLLKEQEELEAATKERTTTEEKYTSVEGEVKLLESQLVNAAIAADVFNEELHRFLGRADISLEFKKESGGYNFMRNGRKELAVNLSEGEKTALAFIYFITKLKESGSVVGDTTIVLDDPISSFDSNHLHHAFGFIRHHLPNAKQLIFLTHNFEFFRLLRDWLKGKNDPKKPQNDKAKFFLIQSTNEETRSSEVVPLPDLLLSYESEYHYIFKKVLEHKDRTDLSFAESHFVGNSSRKILEAFLAFKYPSHRADFAGLLEKACGEDKTLYHKVYSFINKYSHHKRLEVFGSTSDNIFAESQNIVGDVFAIMNNLDSNHFDEMQSICRDI